MEKYNAIVAELESERDLLAANLHKMIAEMQSKTEQLSRLGKAISAMKAVAGMVDAPSPPPPKMPSLLDMAIEQRRAEAAQLTVRERILTVLRESEGPRSRAEVVALLSLVEDVNESTVASTLSKLIGTYGVRKTVDNRYFIDPVAANAEGPDVDASSPS